MATSSIHIATGGNGYFAHNSRESKTVNAIFDDEQNFCSCTNAEAFDLFKKELAIRTEAYQTRTGQKLQSKTATHLSAIVNFNKEHTPQDIKKLCDYLEKELDTKVLQFAMHRDEGHIAENGEKIKNYHAHIEFIGLDSLGNSIKRKLGKKELINLQTKTAEILNMQRGRNYVQEKAKRPKRLDTYEFKKAKENESKLILATKKDLQDANNQLRTFMKENGALRTDYAELEKLKKELEEKLKAKDLTIEEIQDKFKEIEENFRREKGHLESVVELKEIEIDDLRTKNYQIETFSDNLENQNKVLISQNEILEEKVLSLEEKIVPRANMSDYEAMKEDLKSVDENIETFENHFKLPKTGNLVKLMQWVETKFSEMKSQIKSLFQENQDLKEEIEFLKMKNEKLIDEKADLLMELGSNDSNFKEEDHLEKLVKNLENRPKVKLK